LSSDLIGTDSRISNPIAAPATVLDNSQVLTPLTDINYNSQESLPVPESTVSATAHNLIPVPVLPPYDFGTDSLGDSALNEMDWMTFPFQADLSQIYQDIDFDFDASLPFPDPEIQRLDELSVATAISNPDDGNTQIPARERGSHSQDTSTKAFSAFKRSPWLWTPARQDHAYAENSQLAVNEFELMATPDFTRASQHQSYSLPELKEGPVRDEILAMVLKFSKSTVNLRAFPSLKLLNILMQAFFVRENAAVDPWLHVSSFDPSSGPTQLIAGVIAAGSSYFAAADVWKMGLALQETVKLAICDALDEDNRNARKLSTAQTFLLWMELGLWSGFRRKMEIGESFAHTVPTVSGSFAIGRCSHLWYPDHKFADFTAKMLRRAGAFQSSHYRIITPPSANIEGDALQRRWHEWIEKESLKRYQTSVTNL
jgi:hypothetical protein